MASLSFARSPLLWRVLKQYRPPSRHNIRRYHYHGGNRNTARSLSSAFWNVQQTRLLSSAEAQPQDGDDSAAANPMVKEGALPAIAFVGREDQKVEEQKRRRLSDVSLWLALDECHPCACITLHSTYKQFGVLA